MEEGGEKTGSKKVTRNRLEDCVQKCEGKDTFRLRIRAKKCTDQIIYSRLCM